ncbi:deoxyuridine 5'-triphosphate nucleotidohydrolase [Muribaculaceae bacterium]|nr:deoxyuridine 5'-triphosphate nucleotidohydrolase [Muribaculaceae bacterium]
MPMDSVDVKIINLSGMELPAYGTPMAAGMDVRAALAEPLALKPLQRTLVPTGLRIQLPEGYECQIRPRSGLALKHGVTVANAPGTIDADYRGEIGIILINLSDETFVINPGERIAQMVVAPYSRVQWRLAESLDDSQRGDGGFGHTGLN